MGIIVWRLPAELGGAVVKPRKVQRGEYVGRYEVAVPGTAWNITVPGECLVPVLPDEPPVNSMVLALSSNGRNWQVYVRQSVGSGDKPGRWASAGNTGVVHAWRTLHEDWDQVHVLLWWDKDVVEEGVSVPSGRGPHGFVVSGPEDHEPGIASVRIADGMAKYAFLDQASAIRAAGALLGLAMKERM